MEERQNLREERVRARAGERASLRLDLGRAALGALLALLLLGGLADTAGRGLVHHVGGGGGLLNLKQGETTDHRSGGGLRESRGEGEQKGWAHIHGVANNEASLANSSSRLVELGELDI